MTSYNLFPKGSKYDRPGGCTLESLDRMKAELDKLKSEQKEETQEYKSLEAKYKITLEGYREMSCI